MLKIFKRNLLSNETMEEYGILYKKVIENELTDEEIVSSLKELVKKGITSKIIDIYSSEYGNLFMLSCGYNKVKTVKCLISLGCNINVSDSYGVSALIYAVLNNVPYHTLEVIKVLVENNVITDYKCQFYQGETAYEIAKDKRYLDICSVLECASDFVMDEEDKNIFIKPENEIEENTDIDMKSEEEINAAVSKLALKLRG